MTRKMIMLKCILCFVFLSQVFSLPTGSGQSKKDAESKTMKTSKGGCTEEVEQKFNQSKTYYNFSTGVYVTEIVEVNRSVVDCCKGWVGKDCNVKLEPEEEHPCGNLSCSAYPDARCVIARHCGEDIPLFVGSSKGIIMECLSEDICLGACLQDPCEDQMCEQFPDAICFSDGCKCEPIWLLPTTKKKVKCGNSLVKKEATS